MAPPPETRREPELRPRYGRLTAAGAAVVVTLVTALGGLGVLPSGSAAAAPHAGSSTSRTATTRSAVSPRSATTSTSPSAIPSAAPSTAPSTAPSHTGGMWLASSDERAAGAGTGDTSASDVPAHSGSGRRIVFDMSDQRVWLVDRKAGHDTVARTYLVSGSVTDNLKPGTYAVYSKSMHAEGIQDSGTMEYMVRFTRGANAAIGFHDIPVSHGALVQTRAELGTPRSHGCIRQWRPDARALWDFAPVGTKVVVVA